MKTKRVPKRAPKRATKSTQTRVASPKKQRAKQCDQARAFPPATPSFRGGLDYITPEHRKSRDAELAKFTLSPTLRAAQSQWSSLYTMGLFTDLKNTKARNALLQQVLALSATLRSAALVISSRGAHT